MSIWKLLVSNWGRRGSMQALRKEGECCKFRVKSRWCSQLKWEVPKLITVCMITSFDEFWEQSCRGLKISEKPLQQHDLLIVASSDEMYTGASFDLRFWKSSPLTEYSSIKSEEEMKGVFLMVFFWLIIYPVAQLLLVPARMTVPNRCRITECFNISGEGRKELS